MVRIETEHLLLKGLFMPSTKHIFHAVLIVCFVSLSGCHYYQDYRQKKGEADIKEEQAEFMRAYRECLKKHEDDLTVGQERCGAYQNMLQTGTP